MGRVLKRSYEDANINLQVVDGFSDQGEKKQRLNPLTELTIKLSKLSLNPKPQPAEKRKIRTVSPRVLGALTFAIGVLFRTHKGILKNANTVSSSHISRPTKCVRFAPSTTD